MVKKKNHEVPGSFSTSILLRFMGEKGVRELLENYRANYAHGNIRAPKVPTANQVRLANLAKECGSYSVAANKAGAQPYDVDYAVRAVSRYEFFTGSKVK